MVSAFPRVEMDMSAYTSGALVAPYLVTGRLRGGLGRRICMRGFGLHLRRFVTTTKPNPP